MKYFEWNLPKTEFYTQKPIFVYFAISRTATEMFCISINLLAFLILIPESALQVLYFLQYSINFH